VDFLSHPLFIVRLIFCLKNRRAFPAKQSAFNPGKAMVILEPNPVLRAKTFKSCGEGREGNCQAWGSQYTGIF